MLRKRLVFSMKSGRSKASKGKISSVLVICMTACLIMGISVIYRLGGDYRNNSSLKCMNWHGTSKAIPLVIIMI